jgi:hypothetical protein
MVNLILDLLFDKIGYTSFGMVCIVIIVLAYRAYRSRIHGGGFNLVSNKYGLALDSSLGRFIFDNREKHVKLVYNSKKEVILNYSQIKSVLLTKNIDEAMMEEFIFEDFSIFDTKIINFSSEYVDHNKSYHIVINTDFVKQYPIYTISQYRVRDLWDFAHFIETDFLSVIGLYKDINLVVQKHFTKFKSGFETVPIEQYDHS